MTTEEELKDAERSWFESLLKNKALSSAIVAALIGVCVYIGGWASRGGPTAESIGAIDTDPCCAVQKATEGKGSVSTNSLAKAFWFGCSLSACHPTPAPAPTPTPTVDAGAPVVFPPCNPPTLKGPDPKMIEQYKRSLPPRHKVSDSEHALFLGILAAPAPSVFWGSNLPWCGNQENVGACEAFTQLDIACARPRGLTFSTQAAFNSASLDAYKWITANDPYPGTWPPNDTGSDSMSGCKWLVKNGYAKSCRVLSGVAAVKMAIQDGPVISGMNWLDSMFTPDRCGNMVLSGLPQGGHAEGIFGFDAALEEWYLMNHWGQSWGTCLNGHCGYHKLTTSQLFGSVLDADFVQPVL